MGEVCECLEDTLARYHDVNYCKTFSSGSAALLAIAYALTKPKDHVILQARTWIATAHAFHLAGCEVSVCDMDSSGRYIDHESLEELLKPNTTAVVITHMNGRVADMSRIREFCDRHRLLLIEDAAQALGSRQQHTKAGAFGDAAALSFSVAKIVSGGQGGAVLTNSRECAKEAAKFRTHGVASTKEVESWPSIGFNFRYTDIQAAIVTAQFEELDARIRHIKTVEERYKNSLIGLNSQMIENSLQEVGPYIEILCDDREALAHHLAVEGIETRCFYPSISKARYISNQRSPVAELLTERGLYLPSGPSISLESVDRVCESLRRFYE